MWLKCNHLCFFTFFVRICYVVMSKRGIVVFICLTLLGGNLYAISSKGDSLFSEVIILSNRYLTYNCSTPDDSVVNLCKETIDWAVAHDDYTQKFYAEKLLVSVLCIKGEVEQGISITREMYEEAKKLNYPLGKALALQAIGSTYMYTGQYLQALSTFSEARPLIYSGQDTLLQANLTVQQIHNYMRLEDTLNMAQGLAELNRLIPLLPSGQRDVYLFYALGYETLLNIETGETGKAQGSLDKMLNIMPNDPGFDIWRYMVQKTFYKSVDKNEQALACLDSVLVLLAPYGHSNMYRNSISEKAGLLEKTNNYSEACRMYALADSLMNILDMEHYTQQIENLHLAYYMDQASIENAKLRSKYLSYVLLCLLISILISVILIIGVRRRNRQLALSRESLNKMRQVTAESIQSKSMFLSNMSHDLRTPLNAIVGFSEILTSPEGVDPELKEQCRDYIRQNSDLLMKLVNDITDFSTLKGAKIKFDFGKYDAVALCRNVLETVAKVKQTDAQLSFTSAVESLELETDSGRLQQVLINLLTNAAKFTKTGYIRLLLDFDRTSEKAIFTVEDTGCGIPLEKQSRIFERFEKLHESIQGVGLGLSICKLIVDHVNGKIWIDSTYTEGARFIFTHPINHTS